MKFYFAHPYKTRDSAGERRIIHVTRNKGHEIINPFDGEDDILEEHGVKEYYGNVKQAVARSFFYRDLNQVKECDAIIGWVPRGRIQAVGTPMELMYAWREKKASKKKKYIIIISEIPSPFFICIADEFYPTIHDYENGTEWVIE